MLRLQVGDIVVDTAVVLDFVIALNFAIALDSAIALSPAIELIVSCIIDLQMELRMGEQVTNVFENELDRDRIKREQQKDPLLKLVIDNH